MNDKETTVILITSEMYIVEYWYLQTTFGSSFDEWVIIRASIIFLMKTEIDPYQWPQKKKVDCNSYKFVNLYSSLCYQDQFPTFLCSF